MDNAILNSQQPIYLLEEEKLRANLSLIKYVAEQADVEIILAFKAYALWKTFPIFQQYIHATTASSLYEARLAFEEFGCKAHTYSPAYSEEEITQIVEYSSHLTFNSLTQYARYHALCKQIDPHLSIGLRVNPEYSEVGTALYNPCAPGSRFGVTADKLPATLSADIEGFHCHCHCESGAEVFERTLKHIEEKFSGWFQQLKWINFGGGHLVTRKDYNIPLLIRILCQFRKRYPWLKVIMEPGSAFGWQTGDLLANIVDIVEDHGIRTAILNVSFTCHMPDCLEMPYQPEVANSMIVDESHAHETCVYRLGGNSCLSGDFMGYWRFSHPLEIGERIVFKDMLHYTTVKTNMFNGIPHPSIALLHTNGTIEMLRVYDYDDYKSRMD